MKMLLLDLYCWFEKQRIKYKYLRINKEIQKRK